MALVELRPLVGIIMGSQSDWETMEHAAKQLGALNIPFEAQVVSAHRTPDLLFEYAAQAAAVHGGLRARSAGVTAPPGYLAALRDAHLCAMHLDDVASPLQIRAHRLFGEAANTVYQCQVSAGGVLLAEGRITIILRV